MRVQERNSNAATVIRSTCDALPVRILNMPASAIRRDELKFRLIQTGRDRVDPRLLTRRRLAIWDFLLIGG